MTKEVEVSPNDLDAEIEHYTNALGYRLDMIFPADNPREALVSKGGESLRLVAGAKHNAQSQAPQVLIDSGPLRGDEWIVGRAGMEYLDLIPARMDGRVIASHIRLTTGGEVPDYVHYHKVDFQMIRCIKGRIKVVYEDQGDPFWLEPGDWVIQPPEIRHRVLECVAGSEVIEISMPAEHETWIEHELTLPTADVRPEREFNDQRFVRYIAPKV